MSIAERNVFSSLLRFVIYIRVSTGRDSQKESLKNQLSFFENYISSIGGQLVDVYTDAGKSGTNIVKRTEMQRLMKDARKGMFDVVLVKSISRWSRDTVDSINLVRELKSLSINLKSYNEGYDASKDDDEFILALHSSIASKESKNTSDRIKFSLIERARLGKHHGTPPFGYDKVEGKLVPNPYQATIVKQIFDMYLKSGWGFQKIANHLNEADISSPRLGQKWYDTSVKCIISNPHYTGKLVQRRESVKDNKLFLQKKGYKERIKNEPEQLAVVLNTHEPLIDNEIFMEARNKCNVKSEKIFRGRGKKSLFARLAFCSECGAGLNYKNDRKGYVCGTYQKNGSKYCSSHFIKHVALKTAVLDDISALATESLNMKSLLQISIKRVGLNTSRLQNELANITSQLKLRKRELINLTRRLALSEGFSKEIYDETVMEITREQETLKARATELEKLLSNEESSTQYMQSFQNELRKFVKLDVPDEETLRGILHNLIRKIEINSEGIITINYNFMNPLTGKGA